MNLEVILIRKLSPRNCKVKRAKHQILKALQYHRNFKTSDFLDLFHSMLAQKHQALKMQTLISVKWWIREEESKIKRWLLANIWNHNLVSQQRSQIQLKVATNLDWTIIESHNLSILILNPIQRAKRLQTAAMAPPRLVCRSLIKGEKKKNYKMKQTNFKVVVSLTLNAQLKLNASLIMKQLSNSSYASKLVKMSLKINLYSLAIKRGFILQKDKNLKISNLNSDIERSRCLINTKSQWYRARAMNSPRTYDCRQI